MENSLTELEKNRIELEKNRTEIQKIHTLVRPFLWQVGILFGGTFLIRTTTPTTAILFDPNINQVGSFVLKEYLREKFFEPQQEAMGPVVPEPTHGLPAAGSRPLPK